MRWLLRLGIASDRNSRTSYDQMVISDPLQFHVALEFAKRTADAMIDFAIAKSKCVEPLMLGGEKFAHTYVKAAFTARVLASAGQFDYLDGDRPGTWAFIPQDWPTPGISDAKLGKVDVLVGPDQQDLPWALALGVGKEAVTAGVKVLGDRVGKYLLRVKA